jgi:hypothetical protein
VHPQTQVLPHPLATTAAWLVIPPLAVSTPLAAHIPPISSGEVSSLKNDDDGGGEDDGDDDDHDYDDNYHYGDDSDDGNDSGNYEDSNHDSGLRF